MTKKKFAKTLMANGISRNTAATVANQISQLKASNYHPQDDFNMETACRMIEEINANPGIPAWVFIC